MKALELTLLVTAIGLSIAFVGLRVRALVVRLRGRRIQTELTCPKRGSRVECVLVLDEKRARYVAVDTCSVFGRGRPLCTESCAWLLNRGLPLGEQPIAPTEQERERVHLPIV